MKIRFHTVDLKVALPKNHVGRLLKCMIPGPFLQKCYSAELGSWSWNLFSSRLLDRPGAASPRTTLWEFWARPCLWPVDLGQKRRWLEMRRPRRWADSFRWLLTLLRMETRQAGDRLVSPRAESSLDGAVRWGVGSKGLLGPERTWGEGRGFTRWPESYRSRKVARRWESQGLVSAFKSKLVTKGMCKGIFLTQQSQRLPLKKAAGKVMY